MPAMYTNDDLMRITQGLSQSLFGRTFKGEVCWNSRLRTSAGRYSRRHSRIDINPKYIEHYGEDSLTDTLKHELIHYHFPSAGHGPTFAREAQRIQCSRFCRPLPGRKVRYLYQCQGCGLKFPRQRRIDVKKYRCGICKSILSLCEL